MLEEALADGFLVGGHFTVADVDVAEVVRYADGATELFKAAPRPKASFEAVMLVPPIGGCGTHTRRSRPRAIQNSTPFERTFNRR